MKEWGIEPRQWRRMSVDDQAQVIAYELFWNTREAYREEAREEVRKQKEKGINPYQAMRQQMGL